MTLEIKTYFFDSNTAGEFQTIVTNWYQSIHDKYGVVKDKTILTALFKQLKGTCRLWNDAQSAVLKTHLMSLAKEQIKHIEMILETELSREA